MSEYKYKDNNIEVYFKYQTGDTGSSGVYKYFPTFSTTSDDTYRYKSNEEINAFKLNGTSMVQNAIVEHDTYTTTTQGITPPSWAKGVKISVIGQKGDKGAKGSKGQNGDGGDKGDDGDSQGAVGQRGDGGYPVGHTWAISGSDDQRLLVYAGTGGMGGDRGQGGDGGDGGDGGTGGDGGQGGEGGINAFEDIFLFGNNRPTINTWVESSYSQVSFSTTGDEASSLVVKVFKGSKGNNGNNGAKGAKGSKGGKGGNGGTGNKGANNVWGNGYSAQPYQLNQHRHAHTVAADFVSRYGGNWSGQGVNGQSFYYGAAGNKGNTGAKGSKGGKGANGANGNTGNKGADSYGQFSGSKSTGDTPIDMFTPTNDYARDPSVSLYWFTTDDDYADTT